MHFEHHMSVGSAPRQAARRAKRTDRGLPVGAFCASRWNQQFRRLQERPMAENDILLPARRDCFGA